jgi:flavin reductase
MMISTGVQEPFRLAMRRMAATVSIVTTRWDGTAYGMTATSVSAVSMTPPTLLVAINQQASLHDPLISAGIYWVNLLKDEHDVECSAFSGKVRGSERFRHGHWEDLHGVPRLVDAQANILCEVVKTVPFATHTIVLGSVCEALTAEDINPLIYIDGQARPGLLTA